MKQIDINCDIGESFGAYAIGDDTAVMEKITSANIACGFHAGDPTVMAKTVALAVESNVQIGAHPGFPDMQGFGRRQMDMTKEEIYHLVTYQIGALDAFTKRYGTKIKHVKAHGALYNMAAKDREIAQAIIDAIINYDRKIVLYGLAGSHLVKEGYQRGIMVAEEVFADRTYQEDGSLTPRSEPNALIHDKEAAIEQAVKMVERGLVTTVTGKEIAINANTICIHGDKPDAAEFATGLREAFEDKGITVKGVAPHER